MAVQYDAEPENDGWSALFSSGSRSRHAAEVVEMVETDCNNGTSSHQAPADNTKNRERKLDRYRNKYNRGHRDKIVSKYQKRKETKRYPASATNSNISLSSDEEGRFKAENNNVNDVPVSADDLRDTCIVIHKSISRSDSLHSHCSTSGSAEGYQHQTQPSSLSDFVNQCNQSRAENIQDTGQVLHSDVIAQNGIPLHRLSATAEGETDTESSCEQTTVCSTSSRSTLPSASAAPGFCEGVPTQSSSGEAVGTNMQVDFEDISVDAASAEQVTGSSGDEHEDLESNVEEVDPAVMKTIRSCFKCWVQLSKLQSPLKDGISEWHEAGTVWRQLAAGNSIATSYPLVSRTTANLQLDSWGHGGKSSAGGLMLESPVNFITPIMSSEKSSKTSAASSSPKLLAVNVKSPTPSTKLRLRLPVASEKASPAIAAMLTALKGKLKGLETSPEPKTLDVNHEKSAPGKFRSLTVSSVKPSVVKPSSVGGNSVLRTATSGEEYLPTKFEVSLSAISSRKPHSLGQPTQKVSAGVTKASSALSVNQLKSSHSTAKASASISSSTSSNKPSLKVTTLQTVGSIPKASPKSKRVNVSESTLPSVKISDASHSRMNAEEKPLRKLVGPKWKWLHSHIEATSAMSHHQSHSGDAGSSEIPQEEDVSSSCLVRLHLHSELPSDPAAAASASSGGGHEVQLQNLKLKLFKDLEEAVAPSDGIAPFSGASNTCNLTLTLTSGFSESASLNEFNYTSTPREILSGLHTTGRLGLFSHSEIDWSVCAPVEGVKEDKAVQDMDVLSLYEYDTFLESEEESEEWSRSASRLQEETWEGACAEEVPTLEEGACAEEVPAWEEGACAEEVPAWEEGACAEEVPKSAESQHLQQKVATVVKNSRTGQAPWNSNKDTPVLRDSNRDSQAHGNGNKTGQSPGNHNKDSQSLGYSTKHSLVLGKRNKDSQAPCKSNKYSRSDSSTGSKDVQAFGHADKGWAKKMTRHMEMDVMSRLEQPGREKREPARPESRRSLQPKRGCRYSKHSRSPTAREQTRVSSFQRIQHSLEETKRELEAELKHHIDSRNIPMATETVEKIHQHDSMKIDRGLVLSLLHLLIREGAVPQLMRVFTFVCNQGLFSEEVCNAYIRLGCSDSSKYDRQLKNIFQYLQHHSIHPAGDCLTALLRAYSDHQDGPKMFWLMLSYFESIPGFAVPQPLLEVAVARLLQHGDQGAWSRFNQWVLTTRPDALQMLDLSIISKVVASLQPATLSRLWRALEDSEEDSLAEMGKEAVLEEPTDLDLPLGMPPSFSDHNFQFYRHRIQDCEASCDWGQLAQVFAEACRNPNSNRLLLKEYADALLKAGDVVAAVDTFLRRLYWHEQAKETVHKLDTLALAHLAALVLHHVCINCHAEMTLTLLEVIVQCPLVPRKLLINSRDVGVKVVEACLKCSQPSEAAKIFKEMKLRKDHRGMALVKDLLRQLVAAHDIPSAFSVLSAVASHASIGVADLEGLSRQLTWHALNAGNIGVAVDLLRLQRQRPTAFPTPLPSPLLRALLVACCQTGYKEVADSLFEVLKLRKVYNSQAFSSRPYVFKLSTMLAPAEMRLCVLDRLKELYHKLCTIVARGGTLVPFDRGLAIQLLPEHDPGLLALPFLALAPRSLEQATQVLMNELHKLTPSLCSIFSQRCKMVVVDPASLVIYLKNYDSACLKQGLCWEDETSVLLPGTTYPSVPQADQECVPAPVHKLLPPPPPPPPWQPLLHAVQRQTSVPTASKTPNLRQVMKRRSSAPPVTLPAKRPFGQPEPFKEPLRLPEPFKQPEPPKKPFTRLRQPEPFKEPFRQPELSKRPFRQSEPSKRLFRQPEPFRQPVPFKEPFRQSELPKRPFRQSELPKRPFRQPEPSKRPFRQVEPSKRPFRQLEPSKEPFRQSELPMRPFRQSELPKRPFRQPEPSKRPFRQLEPSNEPFRHPELPKRPFRKPEPSKRPFRQPEPSKRPFRQPEPSKRPFRQAEPSKRPFRHLEPSKEPFRQSHPRSHLGSQSHPRSHLGSQSHPRGHSGSQSHLGSQCHPRSHLGSQSHPRGHLGKQSH